MKPARRLWPPYSEGSRPAASTKRLTICPMLKGVSASGNTRPPRPIRRKTGPLVVPADDSQSFTASTGHAFRPRTIGTTAPWPSWSVLERRICTRSPSATSSRSSTSSIARVDLLIAPPKPTRSSAKSRLPPSESGTCSSSERSRSLVRGFFCFGATPSLRRMPRSVVRTPLLLWPLDPPSPGGRSVSYLRSSSGPNHSDGSHPGADDPALSSESAPQDNHRR